MDEEMLFGGVANAGAVTRVGDHVLRPSNPYSASIHHFLRALRAAGFDGASLPAGVADDGRERFEFLRGDVAVPPYAAWAQADAALASIAVLLRRFHEAQGSFVVPASAWSAELADPHGGSIITHNDVCLENIIFRDGVAVGLIDFDYAAPGRAVYDLAQCARMCVPIDDDINAARLGWLPADRAARLRIIADAYGLDRDGRSALLDEVTASIENHGEFVRRRVDAGDRGFIAMWNEMGGEERFDRRRRWFAMHRPLYAQALR